MQDIIKPTDRALLKSELTKEKKLRSTNKSNNEIYIVTAHDAPHVMQEIGRLREIAFRYYGGGTGFPVDIDEFDTMEDAYRQLIVWSPEDEQILGGYRFLCGSSSMSTGSRCWLLRICSISRKSLIKSSSLIRSSWAVLSLLWNISLHVLAQKDCLCWIICGMVWELCR